MDSRARTSTLHTFDAAEAAVAELPAQDRAPMRQAISRAKSALQRYERLARKGATRQRRTGQIYRAGGFVLANDATGVGTADDVLIPFLVLGLIATHLLEKVTELGFTDLDIKAMTICSFCSYCVDRGMTHLALRYLLPLIAELEAQHSQTGEDIWSYHLRICRDIRDRIERHDASARK